MGETIEVQAPAGVAEAYLTRPDATPHPGVLLHLDAIGLRPRIEEMSDRIASWGYVVLAPNVFYRDGRAAALAPRVDLHVAENRKRFMAGVMGRIRAYSPQRAAEDAEAWVRELLEHAEAPIGVVGYCMGARLAVRTAAQFPDLVAAVGGFHGGRLATDAPDSPHLLLSQARAEFVFGHADHDASMPPEAVERLEQALLESGLRHTNEVYARAAHGYTMSDTSEYDEAATERHFTALQALLARTLG